MLGKNKTRGGRYGISETHSIPVRSVLLKKQTRKPFNQKVWLNSIVTQALKNLWGVGAVDQQVLQRKAGSC